MGVLNATPDSFSDGGRHLDPAAALASARAMVAAGAAVLDVGGESTRPGADPVSAADELGRVLPVIEALAAADLRVPISIDTRKASVAREAVAAGAALVNDVTGLADPEMAQVAAEAGAALVLGHIQGDPRTMQAAPIYDDVVSEVRAVLSAARDEALAAGLAPEQILVDPGIGFGKTLDHNLTLLTSLAAFADLGPVVVGVSRKSMLGALLDGRPTEQRLAGGLGAAVFAALGGARLVRTHDVAETVDALRVAWRLRCHPDGAGGPHVA
jgi:dihydropteroate synthase